MLGEMTHEGTTVSVRRAQEEDAAQIAFIYNQGVADRVATFETEPRTSAQVRTWLDGVHPVVVAEEDSKEGGEVVAFAATFAYRHRACYRGVAEFSVYVRRDRRGRGFGHRVMEGLLEEAARSGFWKLLSRVFPENRSSLALLHKLGFREVGVYEKHAQLDGVWRDVVIVERLLHEDLETTPHPG